MKGKQLIPAVLASVLIGAALGGPATAAVAASAAVATSAALTAVTASPSTQTFYVDGEQVDLEAYVINGHNYVQLRDIGRAVDFGVEYDQSTNRVLVDTSSPYTEEATASTPSGVVTIPQTDEPLRLQEGDQVLCDDGTVYKITDLRLWEEPEPLPIYDQTRFPELRSWSCRRQRCAGFKVSMGTTCTSGTSTRRGGWSTPSTTPRPAAQSR